MADAPRIPLVVECYAGYTADERPVAIRLGGRPVAVREIMDRWYGEDHAYFKFVGDDGAVYIIRQDRSSDRWELILMEIPSGSARQVDH
ncbi:MAG TPA: hypothetical protein VLH58_01330 [Candidatus Methylomirabilis sp.]|nr:hypothetical protein [Candidatus Methylomirabilis sp.]HSC69962.1 hypothetical protein [Candidatus Methylomirabilis sp.]